MRDFCGHAAAAAGGARRIGGAALALALKHNFNPDHPRIPAGNPGGGCWTDGSGGGSGLVRVAGGDEEEEKPEELLDPLSEARDAAFSRSYREIRRLDPNNPKLTYASSGGTPSWDTVNAYQQELAAVQARVSNRIGSGHAFDSHAAELGVTSRSELADLVRGILQSPSRIDDLPRGRTGYYDRSSNMFVVVNPADPDNGSVYKLRDGESYIDKLLDSGR